MKNALYLDNDLLELEGIDEAREKLWCTYQNNEIPIPRVTHIIKQCSDQSGLIDWASRLGKSKSDYIRDKALEIGTIVHELIDRYIICYTTGKEFNVDYSEYRDDYQSSIYNAVENFKIWVDKLEKNGTPIEKVLFIEEKVTNPWFGGTVDAIVTINSKNYLIDFKTSRSISYDYLIQASAYMWTINNGYCPHIPHIDGIGIIRVDKGKVDSFNELFLNEFIPEHYNIILNLQNCFFSYVNSYYRTINVEYLFKSYSKTYKPISFFNEV